MAAAGWLSKDVAIIAVPIVTLLLGLLIGWLGQRSGFCSIGGFRDFFMFRHTRLLYGYLALIIGGFIGYLVFSLITPAAFEGFFWLLKKGFMPVPGAPAGLTRYRIHRPCHYRRDCSRAHRCPARRLPAPAGCHDR